MFFLFFALQLPAAAHHAAGGVMRFATDEVAFIGGFAGVAADVWLIEPFGYLSHNAGVWAIQAGASVPVVRLETVRGTRSRSREHAFAEDGEALRPAAAIKANAAKVVEEREPKSMNHRPFRELTKDFSPERRERIEAIKARMREEDRHAALACSPPRRNAAPSPCIVQSSGAS